MGLLTCIVPVAQQSCSAHLPGRLKAVCCSSLLEMLSNMTSRAKFYSIVEPLLRGLVRI